MTDTAKSSWITDHPFEPRLKETFHHTTATNALPPNSALCQICNMAEAAHAETTVKR